MDAVYSILSGIIPKVDVIGRTSTGHLTDTGKRVSGRLAQKGQLPYLSFLFFEDSIRSHLSGGFPTRVPQIQMMFG